MSERRLIQNQSISTTSTETKVQLNSKQTSINIQEMFHSNSSTSASVSRDVWVNSFISSAFAKNLFIHSANVYKRRSATSVREESIHSFSKRLWKTFSNKHLWRIYSFIQRTSAKDVQRQAFAKKLFIHSFSERLQKTFSDKRSRRAIHSFIQQTSMKDVQQQAFGKKLFIHSFSERLQKTFSDKRSPRIYSFSHSANVYERRSATISTNVRRRRSYHLCPQKTLFNSNNVRVERSVRISSQINQVERQDSVQSKRPQKTFTSTS